MGELSGDVSRRRVAELQPENIDAKRLSRRAGAIMADGRQRSPRFRARGQSDSETTGATPTVLARRQAVVVLGSVELRHRLDDLAALVDSGVTIVLLPSQFAEFDERSGPPSTGPRIILDPRERSIVRGKRSVPLTRLEYEFLSVLADQPGRLVEYDALSARVWGRPTFGDTEPLRSLVKRLRRKLSEQGVLLDIVCIRGWGFRLVESSPEHSR